MEDFKLKVKNTVKNNFAVSVDKYLQFENKHRFFEKLSIALSDFMDIESHGRFLDIGCGYGISTAVLKNCYSGDVLGIDISSEMVNYGKSIYPDIELKVSDGEDIAELTQNSTRLYDAVFYNAAIFIFPDPLSSFKSAYNLLKNGGKIGFSHYPSINDDKGKDIFDLAFELNNFDKPKKRVISDLETCKAKLLEAGFHNLTETTFSIPIDTDFLIDFFHIPAQSASLFPKNSYQERVEKVTQLFSKLKDFQHSGKVSWALVKASK